MFNFKLTAILLGFGLGSVVAADEILYSASAQHLNGHVLFDQTLEVEGLVTVKPDEFVQSEGDVSALKQCLWSVKVTANENEPKLTPGKMICIGPKQEVLETIPQGTIEMDVQCISSNCTSFKVLENTMVSLTLTSEMNLTLQPRNERK